MEKFVHSYLSASFEVRIVNFGKTDKQNKLFGFDAIFPKGDNNDEFIFGDRLLKELVLAAYVDEVQLHKFVDGWVKINYPEADLKTYWGIHEPRQFITLDGEPNRNGRVYNEEVIQRIRNQFIETKSATFGELDHPDQPKFISSRKKKDLDKPE